MSEKITITSQQATAPSGPTPGATTWATFYGTPAITVTVTASTVTNSLGTVTATINVPLGN